MTRKTWTILTVMALSMLVWHQGRLLADSRTAEARAAVASAGRAEARAAEAAETGRRANGQGTVTPAAP